MGIGKIVVDGVEELRLVEYTVTPDCIEAGTFIMFAATTGEVLVRRAVPEQLKMELEKLREMGVDLNLEEAEDTGARLLEHSRRLMPMRYESPSHRQRPATREP